MSLLECTSFLAAPLRLLLPAVVLLPSAGFLSVTMLTDKIVQKPFGNGASNPLSRIDL